jgi:hypothetical protein
MFLLGCEIVLVPPVRWREWLAVHAGDGRGPHGPSRPFDAAAAHPDAFGSERGLGDPDAFGSGCRLGDLVNVGRDDRLGDDVGAARSPGMVAGDGV